MTLFAVERKHAVEARQVDPRFRRQGLQPSNSELLPNMGKNISALSRRKPCREFVALSIAMLCQPLATLGGQAVFLQAAVGLVGNGHFDQAVGQGRLEVALAEGFAV